jgi:heme oxygenase
MLDPLLRKALGLPDGTGLSFHQTPADYHLRWRGFLEHIDRLPFTPGDHQAVLDGALATMRGMCGIYREVR